MKKYLFPMMMLLSGWVTAQNQQVIRATTDADLSDKIATTMQYVFPEFTKGDVLFLKLGKSSGMLNYNVLVGEMQLLDDDEIMSFDVKDVVVVEIGGRIFFPHQGREFAEQLYSTDKGQLRVRRKGTVAPVAKKGAMGTSSSSSGSIESISSFGTGDVRGVQSVTGHRMAIESDILITVKSFYYLVGTKGKPAQITNVKAFTKQFPAHRTQIEEFAKANNIRYNNADDLRKLLAYCSEL